MEKKGRGRPRQDRAAQKASLIATATDVLLSGGFARFTIDAVANAGGIAKKTIYSHVANREELVGEIVASWTRSFAAHNLANDEESPALSALLARIHRVALSAEAISLFRMIVSDPEARAQLGQIYNENGIEQGVRSLVACMSREGEIEPSRLETVARAMLSWLIGEPLRRAALGLDAPYELTDEQVDQRMNACIELFTPLLKQR